VSEATTASATPRPITTATSAAIAHFVLRLMPPVADPPSGGGAGSGLWPMWRVGSSCISGRV
jgi:hypothetical protein